MPLYSYSKTKPKLSQKLGKIFSLCLISGGLLLLFTVIYPIVTFELYYARKFEDLTSPIADSDSDLPDKLTRVLGVSLNDFTRASLWFPQATPVYRNQQASNNYTLSIPQLKIENARVIIGSEDLSRSLIHFAGSMPGTVGNPVIFGHSTLLLFYNPSDYKAIFSKLPDLSLGDEISVDYDNVRYNYKVYKMYITSPKDLKVLDQNVNEEILTLVTCVPPGTYFKRFIVKARLEKI